MTIKMRNFIMIYKNNTFLESPYDLVIKFIECSIKERNIRYECNNE